MPVIPSVLESPDGKYYYSLYPLRPGKTKVETFQLVPYASRKYTYVKKFYYRIPSIEIGVTPMDMELSGAGLTKVRTDPDENVAVYRIGSIEAGTEVQWVLSGGTPAAVREEAQATQTEPGIRPSPNAVGRNALIIGPLILIGFILILWHAYNRSDENVPATQDLQKREIGKRRNELLDHLADLDHRYEMHLLDKKEYLRQREKGKGMLRRIALLLKKN